MLKTLNINNKVFSIVILITIYPITSSDIRKSIQIESSDP